MHSNQADTTGGFQFALNQSIDQLIAVNDQATSVVAECQVNQLGMLNINLDHIGHQTHYVFQPGSVFIFASFKQFLDARIDAFQPVFQLLNNLGPLCRARLSPPFFAELLCEVFQLAVDLL